MNKSLKHFVTKFKKKRKVEETGVDKLTCKLAYMHAYVSHTETHIHREGGREREMHAQMNVKIAGSVGTCL